MRLLQRVISLTAVTTSLLIGIQSGQGNATSRPTANPTDTTALKSCVAENKKLDILFLMDVSASLYQLDQKPGSDPNGLRAETVRAVTELLATTTGINSTESTDTQKQGTDVNLAFLDFGKSVRNSFSQFSGWQPLGEFRAADDASKIFSQFKFKHGDADTDYVSALDPTDLRTKKSPSGQLGAIDLLQRSNSPCRVLLWFTDGKLDFDRRQHDVPWVKGAVAGFAGVNEAKKLGEDVLCKSDPRHGGTALVDVLRTSSNSSTPLFVGAIGLGRSQDFDLLEGIAEGKNSCGKEPASGRFVNASHPQDLLDAIQEVLLSPPPPPGITPCGNVPVDKQIFQIGSSLQKLSLVVTTRADGATISMVGPRGLRFPIISNGVVGNTSIVEGISIDRGQKLFSVGVGGTRVDYFLVTATLNADVGNWSGNWGLEFCHPGGKASQDDFFRVFVYGDLTVVQGQRELTANRTKSIDLTVVGVGSLSNQSGDLGIDFGKYVAKVNGREITNSTFESATGLLRIPFAPEKSDVGQPVTVEISSQPKFILNPNDKDATPIPIDFQLWNGQYSVRDVPKTPGLIVGKSFSRIDKGNLSSNGTFQIKPGDEDGSICLTIPSTANLKLDDASAKLTSAAVSASYSNCLQVAAGSSPQSIDVLVKAKKDLLHLDSDNSLALDIEWKATTTSGENDQGRISQLIPVISAGTTSVNWCRLFLGVILALLVPLAILYGFNYLLLARIMVPEMAFVANLRFRNGKLVGVLPNGNEQAIVYDPEKKQALISGLSRSLQIEGLVVKGRISTNPFGETFSVGYRESGIVLGSRGRVGKSGDERVRDVPHLGRSDIGLTSSWFVSFNVDRLDQKSKTVDCALVVFGNSHDELKAHLTEFAKDAGEVFGIAFEEVLAAIDAWISSQTSAESDDGQVIPSALAGAPTVDSKSTTHSNASVPIIGAGNDQNGQSGAMPPMAT